MSERIVHLEVNELGGWRRVTSFDLGSFEGGDLEFAAHVLLSLSNNAKLQARITAPGQPAPLMIWDRNDGWREWGVA